MSALTGVKTVPRRSVLRNKRVRRQSAEWRHSVVINTLFVETELAGDQQKSETVVLCVKQDFPLPHLEYRLTL